MENEKIADIVSKDYRKAEVFKQFGLDFCCGGGRSVAQACEQKGIDKNVLLSALREIEKESEEVEQYDTWALDVLIDHIVEKHHTYVRKNLEVIYEFGLKVTKVHQASNPELEQILSLFEAITEELTMHMHKEEFVLFPYIKNMVAEGHSSKPPFGSVENPISMMEFEHEKAGSVLKEIRDLSQNFTPPLHACNTYRVYYAKLQEFEEDLHFHIHLENNILFPKAIKMEAGQLV